MRTVIITLDPHRVYAEVAGFKARELCVDVGARPVWLSRRRVWTIAFHHGNDVIARAESTGYAVTVLWAPRRTPEPLPPRRALVEATEPSDVLEGLW